MNYDKFLWKPIISKKFSEFFVDRTGIDYGSHPMLIFELDDKLIFLKAQSATYIDKNNQVLADYQQELINAKRLILVPKNEDKHILSNSSVNVLFSNDSLVDTSQIYVITKKDFEQYYDAKTMDEILDNTRALDPRYRKAILEQVIFNFTKIDDVENKKDVHVSITELSLTKEGKLERQQTFVNQYDFSEEYKKHLSQAKDLFKKSKLQFLMDEYHKRYETYKSNLGEENIQNYLNKIMCIFIEENNVLNLLMNDLAQKNDLLYFQDTYQELDLELDLSDQEIKGWSDKALEQEYKYQCLSDYEVQYYNSHPKEYEAEFPNVITEFKNYCFQKKLEEIQDALADSEKEAFFLKQNELGTQCFNMKYEYDLEQFKALDSDERHEFFNRVKELTNTISEISNNEQELS